MRKEKPSTYVYVDNIFKECDDFMELEMNKQALLKYIEYAYKRHEDRIKELFRNA